MPFGSRGNEELELLVDHFVGLVTDGRGDLARGRHLFLLRALDSLWDPDGIIDLPYRPYRNPAAFLAMTFDLVGDARFGYSLSLGSSGAAVDAVTGRIAAHLRRRLQAPWTALVEDLERLELPNLGRVVRQTVPEVLSRSVVSRLPEELERLRSWMTGAQAAAFDVAAYIEELRFDRTLLLLGWRRRQPAAGGREQHPTGGDLRSLLRKRLDTPWAETLRAMREPDMTKLLASMPVAAQTLAEQATASRPEDRNFAVAYALATDAPPPGRRWRPPALYVTDDELEEFEFLVGRGAAVAEVRRATRLERWGASLVFPEAYAVVDVLLEETAGLESLHAGGDWRSAVADKARELVVLRREFLQRVADVASSKEEAAA